MGAAGVCGCLWLQEDLIIDLVLAGGGANLRQVLCSGHINFTEYNYYLQLYKLCI